VEAARIPWRRLGEILVDDGVISAAMLEEALAEQTRTNERLGEILLRRQALSAEELANALMDQLGRQVAREASSLSAEIERRVRTDRPASG
jgi:hypothetical protein